MKKRVLVGIVLIIALTFVATVWAGDLPLSGDYNVAGWGGAEELIISVRGRVVDIEVPVADSQGLPNGNWQLYCSRAWTDGNSWTLEAKDNYFVPTSKLTNSRINATIPLSMKGEWEWFRCWGKDLNSGQWLWIIKASKYARNDKQGNPGYEIIVNTNDGGYLPVPSQYSIRN